MRVRKATSAGSRLASSRLTNWSRRAPPCAAITEISACGSLPRGHHRQRELQAQRPALGQFVQPRRGVAVDARAEARAHQLDRLVELEAQLRRADDGAAAVGRRGRRSRAGSRRARPPRRAGWAARCAAGRPAPRAWPRAGGRPRRRSARCPAPICATSASQTVTPSRPAGAAASSSVWPKVGRPAPVRTASARPCTKRGTSSCGCADSQATTRPCARCSRRHCASSEVLPKPAGACTRITGWSRRRSWSACRRGRASWWRGTRGGVTFSSRSSGAPAGVRGGGVATGSAQRRRRPVARIRPGPSAPTQRAMVTADACAASVRACPPAAGRAPAAAAA